MTLNIKVQVDRLPDITVDENLRIQLGIRLSAVLEAGTTLNLEEDARLIQPWLWRKKDDNAQAWSAHEPESWMLCKFDGQNTTQISSADFKIHINVSPDFDTGPQPGFRDRIAQEVDDIIATYGSRAIENPIRDGIISARTVYGLVESLTALPSPVPKNMQVWTALTLNEDIKVTIDDQFFAIPLFSALDDKVANVPPNGLHPVKTPPESPSTFSYTTNTGQRNARAFVFPSLPTKSLELPEESPQLIDLSKLLVRHGQVKFESSDWNSNLALKIAEVLDPSARLMSVLDTVVSELADKRVEADNIFTYREALKADIGIYEEDREKRKADVVEPKQAPDYLRKVLAAMHMRVVGPRTRSSRPTAAPAASFLERLVLRYPELWSDATLLLLAQAGAERKADDNTANPGDPDPMVVTRARLAEVAGIRVERKDKLDEPDGKVALDNETAFGNWLAAHWASSSAFSNKPLNGDYVFAGVATDIKKEEKGVNTELRSTGLIDLMQQKPGTTFRIPLTLSLSSALPKSMQFKLSLEEDAASEVFELDLEGGKFLFPDGKAELLTVGTFVDKTVITLLITRAENEKVASWNLGVNIFVPKETPQNFSIVADITHLALGGKLLLKVTQTDGFGISINVDNSLGQLQSAVLKSMNAQAMRASLSLAYSGPVIAGLMGGWVPIEGESGKAATAAGNTQSAQLAETMNQYIDKEFSTLEKACLAFIKDADPGDISHKNGVRKLIENLWVAAKADAKKRAAQLIPSNTAREIDHITSDALPLSFAVDDLQDFDDKVDLWTRLAGLGVLIARKNSNGDSSPWWSLNVATLHISQLDEDKTRIPLGKSNAVVVSEGEWPLQSLVDPVPLVITETQGVRNAIIRYESQSIVAEVAKRPQLDPQGKATMVVRRPEAYLFPVDQSFPKLPPLTFGIKYRILPYLIAHGGVVPPFLRSNKLDPTSWIGHARGKEENKEKGFFSIDETEVGDWVREKTYLRTVPISAPRLSEVSRLPGLIEGVAPLVAELPVIPPTITLQATEPLRFFTDRDHVNGTLFCPIATNAGVRIDINDIICNKSGKLMLRAIQAGRVVPLLELEINLDDLKREITFGAEVVGFRIEVIEVDAQHPTEVNVSVWRMIYGETTLAEDEPDIELINNSKIAFEQPVSNWQGVTLEVTPDVTLNMAPPAIRWGIKDKDGKLQLSGDKAIYPAELVPQSRPTSILDGIKTLGKLPGRDSVLLAIKRPSTTMLTYDRWINGVFGGYKLDVDEPQKHVALVKAALNDAATRTTNAGGSKGENVLDDPAVEALVIEVIQLFPTRKTLYLERLDTNFHANAGALLGFSNHHHHGTDQAFITITIGENGSDPVKGKLVFKPGYCYEVRVYGAVAEKQPFFAPGDVTNRSRFSPAITASWRDVTIRGELLHLGAPLIHTVEVACNDMPELYGSADTFYITTLRPPVRNHELAAFHLLPEIIDTDITSRERRYQRLRMVDRLALFEQRWSWRGRPHPELGASGSDEFGEKSKIATEFSNFIDMTFLGRSHTDIGPIKEKSISRHHAFGGKAKFLGASSELPPIFLESNLDYRGGANLWRFAVRAKSRYSAMRSDHKSMLRFSHEKENKTTVNWTPLVVPDRANPNQSTRKPKRPNLMLVIPLTEPIDREGAVPPLLALFNEPMFPLFHAGDSIEVVVDVARHPFSSVERVHQDKKDAFKLSWEQLETERAELQKARDELKGLLSVQSTADTATQTDTYKKIKDLEDKLAAAVLKHEQEAGAAMAKGYTANLQKNKETLLDQITACEVKLGKATDPAVKSGLEFLIDQLKKRDIQLDIEIEAAQNAEADSTSFGADLRAIGSPYVKYWPEIAPDPVRTGFGADGIPVAMRCDGPIGYSFDLDVQAGRFDHAGLLISPVGGAVQPWSMVKMRFRRLEMPEFLVDANNTPLKESHSLPTDGGAPMCVALSNCPDDVKSNVTVKFNTTHEGVVVDFKFDPHEKTQHKSIKLSLGTEIGIRTKKTVTVEASTEVKKEFVSVDAFLTPENANQMKLSITASTRLGTAKSWTLLVAVDSLVDIRLIVSRQFTMPDVPPQGDVSVRVRVTPPSGIQERDKEQPYEHAWLSVICLPLIASAPPPSLPPKRPPELPPTDPLESLHIACLYLDSINESHEVMVRPVRLSQFTDGVWCQFAAAMSRVVVSAIVEKKTSSRKVEASIHVTDLIATKDKSGEKINISLRQINRDEKVTDIAFAAEGQPDGNAQIEECLYAVVTRYVYDAFDRLRESPVSIHPMVDELGRGSVALGDASWVGPLVTSTKALFAEGKGRIRIMRVLRGKTKENGGFEAEVKHFPDDFFGIKVEAEGSISNNPSDGAGQVLGISQPIEWE